jgi:hypothetical protein
VYNIKNHLAVAEKSRFISFLRLYNDLKIETAPEPLSLCLRIALSDWGMGFLF